MALYGGNIDNLFGGSAPTSVRQPRNELELGARKLPRPKRRRKVRKPEVSLYPSLSAIMDCVDPFDNILDSLSAGSDQSQVNEEPAREALDALVNAPSRRCLMDDDDDTSQAVQAVRPKQRAPTSSLLLTSSTDHSVSLNSHSSSTSGGSRELLRDFRRISLANNKRRPMSSGSSQDSYQYNFDKQDKPTPSPYDPSPLVNRRTTTDDRRKNSQDPDTIKSRHTYYPSRTSGEESKDHKTNYKSYSTKSGDGLSSFGSLIKSVKDDYTPVTEAELEPSAIEKRLQHLEIEPGLLLPLRGAKETITAIKEGFVEEVSCQACGLALLCIADATFCVCADCKCVSAFEGTGLAAEHTKLSQHPQGSVGLGFRNKHARQPV